MGSNIFTTILKLVTWIFSRSGTLQPRAILRELYKEIEDKKRVGIDNNAFVPNNFIIYLSKKDLEYFSPLLGNLPEQLKNKLDERIKRNGYRILAPVTVKIREGAGLEMNSLDIESSFHSSASSEDGDATSTPQTAHANAKTVIKDDGNTHFVEEQKTQFLDTTKLELEIVEGENIGEIMPLQAGIYTFGRGYSAKIQLCDENQTVSRMHFEIEVASGKASIKDLGSLNGTKLNTVKLTELTDSMELTSGDSITAGNVVLRVV